MCFKNIYQIKNKNENGQKLRLLAEIDESLVPEVYASFNGGTTGGKGGKTVTVSIFEDLKNPVQSTDPMILIVDDMIILKQQMEVIVC